MQIRVAPSLGSLEGNPQDVWKTTPYIYKDLPVVFFVKNSSLFVGKLLEAEELESS